jgi:phosphate uptake regulator
MMKRRIIKQGHNTLTITLPAKWTKRFNLEAGKEVDLTERDNGIFISTNRINENKKTEFNIEDMDIPTIWKYFMVIYREGYDEIRVNFNPNQLLENPYKYFSQHRYDPRYKQGRELLTPLEAIQNFVTRFIDFEIIEPGKDYVIVREMGELTEREFDNSLRRVFLLLEQMAEETLEAIETNNPSLVSHMHDVDINLDKFHDYCVRILNKVGNKDSKKTSLLFSTLYILEMIGDEFKTISHHIIFDKSKKKFDNLSTLANLIRNQLDIYSKLFYKFDQEKIKELAKIDEKLYLSVGPMYKKANEDEKEIFHHLRLIEKYINALLELRIEMEF